ncbi:MAG: YybS family protein [Bacillota bacterium]
MIEFFSLVAALLILSLATVYIPLLSVITALFIPVTLALLVRRLDLRYGLAALLFLIVILSLFTGRIQPVLLLAIQTGPLGILLGLMFKNHVSSGRSLAVAVGFSLLTAVGFLAVVYAFTGNNPFVLDPVDRQVFDLERRLLNQMAQPGGPVEGLDPASVREMEKIVNQLEAAWPVIATSSIAIWFMFSAGLSFWITRWAMSRYGYSVPPSLPFSRWRLPWYTIWGVIAGLSFLLAGDEGNVGGLAQAGKSILWVMGFVFTVNGMSVSSFYLGRWKVSVLVKGAVVVVLSIYLPFAVSMLIALGITDSILNIRRLTADGRTPEEDEKK